MTPSPPTSPRSPTTRFSPISRPATNNAIPKGFLSSRPKRNPIERMTARELHELYDRNKKILSSPSGSSTSNTSYIPRMMSEQSTIEARLLEIEGVDIIQSTLRKTHIRGEEDMAVDTEPERYVSPTLRAKQKALARFTRVIPGEERVPGSFSLQEAIEIEQRAHQLDLERKQRALEKKQRLMPKSGENLTREEREAQIWAYMNHKPTESDLEDNDNEDSDSDGDPSTWFVDDQDDGIKGQDIVYPDEEDLNDIIRVDDAHFGHYSAFYEPHDEGD